MKFLPFPSFTQLSTVFQELLGVSPRFYPSKLLIRENMFFFRYKMGLVSSYKVGSHDSTYRGKKKHQLPIYRGHL